MASEHSIRRYRSWYAKLLRLYSRPHYERFGEGMEQTFNDVLHERAESEQRLLGYALWIFVETSAGIIKESMTAMTVQQRSIIRIAFATAFLLLVPLLAMQFTNEVVWDLADFAVAGALLFGAGLTYELVSRKLGSIAYRVAVGIAVVTALSLVWINLAVGIIGNEGNPANLMYAGVLAVGLIGAFIARFRAPGMARALFATALAQALVAVIALVAGLGFTFVLTGIFVALWLLSAMLFWNAAHKPTSAGAEPVG